MAGSLLQFLSIIASYLGFALIALAMPRNCQTVMGTRTHGKLPLRVRRGRRLAGWTLLALSLAAAIGGNDAAFGFPVWMVVLSLGAFAVMATLSWAPRRLQWLGRLAGGGWNSDG